jgi:hypothetical protein
MRILNEGSNAFIERVTLYLTTAEAGEVRDSINSLLSNAVGGHEHIPSSDFR